MSEELTDEQMTDCRSAFALFDRDGDGAISTRELGPAIRTMGYSPTDTEILDILNEVDTEGEGEIDFPTFLTLMAKKIKEYQGDADLRLAFGVFDKESNGHVTVPDFQHMLSNLYRPVLTEHEISEMTRDADPSHRGFVTYNDHVTSVQSVIWLCGKTDKTVIHNHAINEVRRNRLRYRYNTDIQRANIDTDAPI